MIFIIFIIFSFLSFSYSNVLTGLDILQADNFKLFYNKNIGLVINHTSLNKDGIHIVDLLLEYEEINIKSIFTPEHGLKGSFSAGEKILNIVEEDYDIGIISLYGDKKEPNSSDLEGLDYIIFDIQDIGSRYYTYVSTLTYILNAASVAKIPVLVLDRPNPLGRQVSGPNISSEFYSFIGMHPIPIRHGMTIGELAVMINDEGWLPLSKKADLKIIELKNWDTMLGYFSIQPSPNIKNFKTALIYNGICLLEGTNISEGRGTKTPFLLFGAPWLNSKKILKDLTDYKFSGVSFYQKTFKPISIKGAKYPKYKDELCHGIKIDINQFDIDPLVIAVSILKTIYLYHSDSLSFNNNNFIMNLYGSEQLKENIINKDPIEDLIDIWDKDSRDFEFRREPYLLY